MDRPLHIKLELINIHIPIKGIWSKKTEERNICQLFGTDGRPVRPPIIARPSKKVRMVPHQKRDGGL